MAEVDGKTVMQAPDGRLYQVDPSEVETVARDQGFKVAPDEAVQKRVQEREQYAKYGSTGQQALGLAETAVRTATLGAVPGLSGDTEASRGRANVVAEESPVLNAAAGFAPAVAVGAATAGAGLGVAGTMALEGAAGAYGNVGSLTDEAFKRDQELSAEQVIGAAGTGFFLGAATAGAASAIGKGAGAVRNRLVESSARVSRQAEAKAAEAVGIAGADKAVFRAADNPVEAATLRKAADEARPAMKADVEAALSELDTHAAGTRKSTSSSALDEAFPGAPPAATGDAVRQSPPLRAIIQDIETSLPGDSPLRHATAMWKDDISKAADSTAFQKTATDIENEITALAEQSRDPELAKTLVKSRDDLRAYRSNPDLFGEGQAKAGATKVEQQQALEQARATLGEMLKEHDYSQVAGTKAGRDIQQAASHYADAITALNPESAEAVNAAVARFVNEGPVATGNQVDALLAAPKAKRGVSATEAAAPDMFKDIAGEVAETALDSLMPVPGFGLLRMAWKYRKHIFNLSADARGKVGATADAFLTGTGTVGRAARRGATIIGARQAAVTTHEQDVAQYRKMRSSIELLQKEPERLADMLAQSMGDIPTEAPALHMAVAAKAAAAVEFLQGKLPPAFTFSLANPEGPPPSRSDMLELSSYVQGVTDVPGVLRGIGDGSAMPEAIEAFKAVYPAWYGELQETLTIQCQERARAGQVIPGMRIAQLTSLLDLDVDPTFSDEVAQIAHSDQDIKDQLKAKAPKPNAPSKAGNRSQPSTHGVES